EVRAQAENGLLLDNGFGRKMKFDPDRAFTQAPALVGQGATRDIIAKGILRLDMDLVAKMKVIVHDEIVFSLPEETWESDVERILNAMQFEIQINDNPPMQITAGVSKPGRSWADVYSKQKWLLVRGADILGSAPLERETRKPCTLSGMSKKICKDCASGTREAKYPGPRCYTCHHAKKRADRKKNHDRYVQKKYGLDSGQYETLYRAQGGRCYICQ